MTGGRPGLEVAGLSGELAAVMRGVVTHLMALPGADGAALSMLDGDAASFAVCAGADAPLQGKTIPLERTLGRECLSRGEVTVLRAGAGHEVDRCLTAGARAIVLAPVAYDGAVRGILGVRSHESDAFDADEVESIRMLAAGAAIALRNAELVERLEESARSYRALHAEAADAAIVTDRTGRILDANEAAVSLLGHPASELRGMSARDLLAGEPARSVLREALASEGEVRSERLFRHRDGHELRLEYSARLLPDGRVHTSLRDVTTRRAQEARLRTSLGRLHAVVQTQHEISELALDFDAVTGAIVERAQRLAGAEGAAFHRFEGDEYVVAQASGIAAIRTGARVALADSLSGVAAATGDVVHAPDCEEDARADRETCREVGARSVICAPLVHGGDPVGALWIVDSRPYAFDELDVETTRMMAQFVSSAIRNARELEERRRLVEALRTQGEVVEHMQMGLWVWRPDGDGFRLDYANAASGSAIGVPAAELVGRRLEDVLPAAPPEVRALLARVSETGEAVDVGEVAYGDERIPSGVFSMKAFPLTNGRVAVTFDNVTERSRARRALQESEARFRGAFDSSSMGMALCTLDGTYLQVNERLAELVGYEREELVDAKPSLITHPDDLEEDERLLALLAAGRLDAYSREKRYVRKDGTLLWGAVTVSVVHDFDGNPTHLVANIQDVTAQRDAHLLFAATFEQSIVPKLIADDDRRIVQINRAASKLLGLEPGEAHGLLVDELVPDEPLHELWDSFLEAGTLEAEVWLRRPDGARRRVEFIATANVRPQRHIAVMRDLTRQRELEAQLLQAQKMEAVGRLAGGVAHDFNNLLTAISGYSEFLIDGLEDERLRRHAQEIGKAASRAAALTGQLLAFSRRQVLQPRVLDLNAVVTDMDMMLRRLIGEDVELVTMLEPALGAVRADPTQVEQVIVNLAVNARDAMPQGGALTIETANVDRDGARLVELRLTDTGVGMSDLERSRLFDPFFTTKEGGTGLGLATVYGIVEQSGGAIEVDSAPGHGASFRILLPRVDVPAEAQAPETVGAKPAAGSETILLVEDEPVVRRLLAEILTGNGYSVLQAGDGPSAVELLRRRNEPVDLLVTDVVLPGMSGPEVAHAVLSLRPETHVLYLSGYTDSAIVQHGVLEPGIAFLQKPFSAAELTAKVRGLLDGAPAGVD